MANVLFFYQNKSDSFNASDYKQIQIKLKGKTDKERYAYLNELQDINSLFMMKEAVINHQVDFNEYVEKYGKEWVTGISAIIPRRKIAEGFEMIQVSWRKPHVISHSADDCR